MNKQEEIREGIGKLLPPFFQAMDDVQERQDGELLTNSMMRVEFCKVIETHLDIIFSYLHSQGVVIKVDREKYRATADALIGMSLAMGANGGETLKGVKDLMDAIEPLVEE